ncbi:MAG TPA: acetone carboxylase subunit gamma, partial [Solirubrobacterales bacterium]
YRPPLTADGDTLRCSHCEESLGAVAGNWKEGAHVRRSPLTELAARLGAKVRKTEVIELESLEFFCPSCGSLLEVDDFEAGEVPYQDIRLGHTRSSSGEAF